MEKKLCPPNVKDDEDLYKLKGHHESKDNRNMLSLQFRECDKTINPNCMSKREVRQFLENVYFKVNIIEKRIDFGESTKHSNTISTFEAGHNEIVPIH
jgi:hypothetical protein